MKIKKYEIAVRLKRRVYDKKGKIKIQTITRNFDMFTYLAFLSTSRSYAILYKEDKDKFESLVNYATMLKAKISDKRFEESSNFNWADHDRWLTDFGESKLIVYLNNIKRIVNELPKYFDGIEEKIIDTKEVGSNKILYDDEFQIYMRKAS